MVSEHQFKGFSEEEMAQMLHYIERMQQNLIDYKNELIEQE